MHYFFFQTHPKEVSVHLLNRQYPKQVFHRLLVRKIEYLKQVLDKIWTLNKIFSFNWSSLGSRFYRKLNKLQFYSNLSHKIVLSSKHLTCIIVKKYPFYTFFWSHISTVSFLNTPQPHLITAWLQLVSNFHFIFSWTNWWEIMYSGGGHSNGKRGYQAHPWTHKKHPNHVFFRYENRP